MTREQLEHLIRAAARISRQRELVIIGSQSILGRSPDAPASLLTSMEADIHPIHDPDKVRKRPRAPRPTPRQSDPGR